MRGRVTLLSPILTQLSSFVRSCAPLPCSTWCERRLPRARFYAKWTKLHEQYGKQMRQLMEKCSEQDGERKTRIATLQSTYRSVLLEPYEGEDCLFGPVINPPDRLLQEVSAIYHVTYQAARRRQAVAAAAPSAPVSARPAAVAGTCARPAEAGLMGAAGSTCQVAASSRSSIPGLGKEGRAGSGLSFVWAVSGDFLERIKCCAMQLELCGRKGDLTAPKMHMAKNMRLLLGKR